MKTLLVTLSLALAVGASSVHAQSAAGPGAVIGAIAGGLIGGHNHDNWAPGAIIGGVAGAMIGAAISPENNYQSAPVYQSGPVAYGQPAPVYYPSQPQVVYSQPGVAYAPAPTVVYAPPPPPTVVYVQPTSRYYCAPPAVNFEYRYYSGPHYGWHDRDDRGYYGHHYRRW